MPRSQPTNTQLTTLSSRRTSQSLQMVNKNSQKDSQDRQDEARLLGASYIKYALTGFPVCNIDADWFSVRRDPKAVKIKTGATMQSKKPGVRISSRISRRIF